MVSVDVIKTLTSGRDLPHDVRLPSSSSHFIGVCSRQTSSNYSEEVDSNQWISRLIAITLFRIMMFWLQFFIDIHLVVRIINKAKIEGRSRLSFPLLALSLFLQSASCAGKKIYIVYLGGKGLETSGKIINQSRQVLASVMGTSMKKVEASILYDYQHAFRGFAAKMLDFHAKILSKIPGVVSVFPSQALKLETTH